MTEVAVENARQQWATGHRRLADQASDRSLYLRLLDQVGLVLDELNRRVGQTFTLAELAEAYRDADREHHDERRDPKRPQPHSSPIPARPRSHGE